MYINCLIKKKRNGKLYRGISVSWLCALGYRCQLFPVTAAAALCALSACFLYQLAVQRGGRQKRVCRRTGMQPYKYRACVCCLLLISHLQEESCSQCVKVHLIAMTFFFQEKSFL